MSLESILLAFVLILTGAKLMGQLFRAMGQSPVLGELLAGAIIGPAALGWLPKHDFLTLLSEIGLIILLFELGLETDISQLARVGRHSAIVAILGVVVPFVGGMVLAQAFGLTSSASLLVGATFCATSIGVTAAILKDQGEQQSIEGQIVLGAAFLDDIIGLLLLSVVMASIGGTAGHGGGASSAPPRWALGPGGYYAWVSAGGYRPGYQVCARPASLGGHALCQGGPWHLGSGVCVSAVGPGADAPHVARHRGVCRWAGAG